VTTASGQVASGEGAGTAFTALPWFRSALAQHYALDLLPGTLNLQRVAPMPEVERALLLGGTVLVPPSPETCCAVLLSVIIRKAGVGEYPAVLVRPLVGNYDPLKVELIADRHLRSALNLLDGDAVEFRIIATAKRRYWIAATE